MILPRRSVGGQERRAESPDRSATMDIASGSAPDRLSFRAMRRPIFSSSSVAPLFAGILGVALLGAGCGSSSSSPPDGVAGKTGTGGAAGATGRGGGAGSSAVAGASGTTGSGGSAGATGTGGAAGAAGTTGTGGAAGAAGTTGTGGAAGAAGTTGTGGAAGAAGTTGTGGAAGATGTGGAAGATGTGGAAGATGTGGTAGGSGTGGAGGSGGTNGACTSGQRTCGQNNDVDVCNANGTSSLFLQSCANGCGNGLCTGGCTPGAKRCNQSGSSDVVEQCDSTGTTWQVVQTCTSYCDARNVVCATAAQDITTNTTLDGVVVVDGAFVVHAGATVSSPTGNLTIYATSIIVDLGGSIVVAPTGTTAAGQGQSGTVNNTCSGNGRGGGYGTQGAVGGLACAGTGGPSFGSSTDDFVGPGSPGGPAETSGACNPGAPGQGGGVLRLIASSSISIAGQISANGAQGGNGSCTNWWGSGGGSGGGILLAADQLTVTGTVSAAGGPGGNATPSAPGGNGGLGRVKLLYGTSHGVTGTVTGTQTAGLLPPLIVTSTTHPDPTLVYNDAFAHATFSWSQSFSSRLGYYYTLDTSAATVPTPANGTFLAAETVSLPRSSFVAGANYLHLVSIDPTSTVGTVQSSFEVTVNTTPPTISSSTHPTPTTWVNNSTPFFSWTLPVPDASVQGVHYVFDQYGNTVPTTADTFLPITQKQLIISNVANGIWVFHVVSRDTRGVLTTQGASYQVRIGADPGSGTVSGTVVDASSQPVAGATVTINRGLFTQTTSSIGTYSFAIVPVGTWEVEVTKTGSTSPAVKPATVTLGATTTVNVTLN
jgi:hypothetical protein